MQNATAVAPSNTGPPPLNPEFTAWVAAGIALNDPRLSAEFFDRCGQPDIAAEWRHQLAEVRAA